MKVDIGTQKVDQRRKQANAMKLTIFDATSRNAGVAITKNTIQLLLYTANVLNMKITMAHDDQQQDRKWTQATILTTNR